MSEVYTFLFVIIALLAPGTLTIWNIYNCIAKKPKFEKTISILTFVIGAFLYLFLMIVMFDLNGDWDKAIYVGQYHYPLSSKYTFAFMLILLPGIAGYLTLLFSKGDKLPPLLSALCVAGVLILNVMSLAVALQLLKNAIMNLFSIFFMVYHFNVLLLSVRVVVRHLREQIEYYKTREEELKARKGLYRLYTKLTSISRYALPVLMCMFFIVAVLEIIFVLTGQGLDAPIKMFTDTADWTFSQQIPPPPLEYDGHYLCTVAAGGHKKIVKPTRLGRRRGAIIVVNRQLCIANAFEDVIQERHPAFHRKIRHFYDTHGYPLSRLITNERRADIVYFLMKPLEWVFLIFLYLVDRRPEERIERQYSL